MHGLEWSAVCGLWFGHGEDSNALDRIDMFYGGPMAIFPWTSTSWDLEAYGRVSRALFAVLRTVALETATFTFLQAMGLVCGDESLCVSQKPDV